MGEGRIEGEVEEGTGVDTVAGREAGMGTVVGNLG